MGTIMHFSHLYISHVAEMTSASMLSGFPHSNAHDRKKKPCLVHPLSPRLLSGHRRRLANTPIGDLADLTGIAVDSMDTKPLRDDDTLLVKPYPRHALPWWFHLLCYIWFIVTLTMLMRAGLKALNKRLNRGQPEQRGAELNRRWCGF